MIMRYNFFNLCAICKGVIVLKNRANAPIRAIIDGEEYVIEPKEKLSYVLKRKKYARVTLTNAEKSSKLCGNVVVYRGTVCNVEQYDYDLAWGCALHAMQGT